MENPQVDLAAIDIHYVTTKDGILLHRQNHPKDEVLSLARQSIQGGATLSTDENDIIPIARGAGYSADLVEDGSIVGVVLPNTPTTSIWDWYNEE